MNVLKHKEEGTHLPKIFTNTANKDILASLFPFSPPLTSSLVFPFSASLPPLPLPPSPYLSLSLLPPPFIMPIYSQLNIHTLAYSKKTVCI